MLPLHASDVGIVADIHLRSISTRLSGEPGRRLLEMYYGELARRQGGICLLARDSEDERPCGVAVVLWTRRPLWREVLARAPLRFGCWLALNFLLDPRKVYGLAHLLWEKWPLQQLRERTGAASAQACVLQTLISTAPGRNVGTDLASAAMAEARAVGFRYMFVPAVQADAAANHVYEKVGFQLLMTTTELGKKVNWYGCSLNEAGGAELPSLDNSVASGGPDPLSLSDRFLRKTWVCVSSLLFRFSPAPLHCWRRFLLRAFGAKIGRGARIYPTVRVWAPWYLVLRNESCLGYRVNCYNCATVTLEEGALVSQDATLCTATHDYCLRSFPLLTRPITVGKRAWVCAEAFIGPGVNIGEGAVVGARSCVVADVSPWTVVGGNPAKFLKMRTLNG